MSRVTHIGHARRTRLTTLPGIHYLGFGGPSFQAAVDQPHGETPSHHAVPATGPPETKATLAGTGPTEAIPPDSTLVPHATPPGSGGGRAPFHVPPALVDLAAGLGGSPLTHGLVDLGAHVVQPYLRGAAAGSALGVLAQDNRALHGILASDPTAASVQSGEVPLGIERRTVGSPSLGEVIGSAVSGRLGIRHGHLVTPHVANAVQTLLGAQRQFRRTARPDLSGLSAAERRIFPYAERAHRQYPDVPVSVLMAQDKQESGFNPLAESSAGAFGVSQFIPSTASSYGVQRGGSPQAIQSQLTGEAHLLHDDSFSTDPQGALSSYSGGYAAGDYNNPILEDARQNYAALDKPTHAPPAVVARLQAARQQAQELGLPTHIGSNPAAGGGQSGVPYHAFSQHVARELHLVTSGQYDRGPGSIVVGDSNIGVGHEPEIAARLKLLSAKIGQPVYVISGYRTPQHSVEVGGFPDDPHTKGTAADIGVGSPTLASAAEIPESVYESVGLYRPFGTARGGSSAEDNHVQLLNGGTPVTGHHSGAAPFGVGGGAPLPSSGGAASAVAAGGGTAAEAAQATHAEHTHPGFALTPIQSPISAQPLLAGAQPGEVEPSELDLLLSEPTGSVLAGRRRLGL